MHAIKDAAPARYLLAMLLLAGPAHAVAGDAAALPRIPMDEPPLSGPVRVDNAQGEDHSRAFNTPTDDGRPAEYYFALGVQAARKGDYAHAMAMYKVAASWAYKPAEYNLGVMYIAGQGTPVDLPQAMAWMALAAERHDAAYVRAKQLVYAQLSPAQWEQANAVWRGLLPTYGDASALPRAKARWRETLVNATGSRVGSAATRVMVGGGDDVPNHMNSPNYDVQAGGHVVANPAEMAGVHMADSAVAYRDLRRTDNPYDPRVMPVSGTTSVGALTQLHANGDHAPPAASSSTGTPPR